MFVDQVKIEVKAGRGGNGCNSFYRGKYPRRGVPNGGDGGSGGDVIIRADRNLYTLLDFKYNKHFFADNGIQGSSNNKKGRDALDKLVLVPSGTTITDVTTGCILRDLEKDGDQFVVAKGGRGGLGNNKKQEATEGEPGEQKELLLDLKLIADVGVVGFPNAGKSTLVSVVSNAKPLIAAYPFTTKTPCLGVVSSKSRNFVIADIPGLIENSSQGRGLGDRFLRHVERTKVLIHLIDMSGFEGRDPLSDYRIINRELKNYSESVAKKKQVIVANKMDLDSAKVNLKAFKKHVKRQIYPVSALKKQGLEELIEAVSKKI